MFVRIFVCFLLVSSALLFGCSDDGGGEGEGPGTDVSASDVDADGAVADAPADTSTDSSDTPSETAPGDTPADQPDLPAAPQITIDTGAVRGVAVDGVMAYRGIPFAMPPVGDLRWKPPQPMEPWTETFDATAYGPICPQLDSGEVHGEADEDCLTVNVWTPDTAPAAPLPVFVWIHGGGYEGLSGRGEFETFVRESDMVVVSFNYRLGAFGFLGHSELSGEDPDNPSSGNYGLQDQHLALEWVQRNVAAFGGDPSNVTIQGFSAGGGSVCQQMVSPGSAGLFHRSIIQSAQCDLGVRPMTAAEAQANALAAALACDDPATMLECLRSKPWTEVLLALPPKAGLVFGEGVNWGPVVDGVVIPDLPSTLVAQGEFAHVPVLLGTVRDEGTLFVFLAGLTGLTEVDYPGVVTDLAPILNVDMEAVLDYYPPADYPNAGAALSAILGHGGFNCPTRRDARAFSAAGVPTYLYHFVYPLPTLPALGIFHAVDSVFLLDSTLGLVSMREEERPLHETIVGYWSRFATTGDPNGDEAVEWPGYETGTDEHLNIDMPASVGSGLLQEVCDFWDSISP